MALKDLLWTSYAVLGLEKIEADAGKPGEEDKKGF